MKSTLDSAMALHKSLLEGATKNNASVNFLENMKSQGRSPQEQSSNAFLSGMQAADQEKYDRVRDWLMDVNQKATEKRMIYENRMLAQQSITPQIMAYMQSATKMDPVTRKMFAQQIMEDWNRDTGEQGQVLAIDATNPFLVTLQGPQGTQLVDLRALVRDDPIMQRELAMQMPAYLEQQRYERGVQREEMDMRHQGLGLQERGLGLREQELGLQREKMDLARNPQQQTVANLQEGEQSLSGLPEKVAENYIKEGFEKKKRIPSYQKTLTILDKMDQILKENPKISQSLTTALNSSGEEGLFTWFSRNISNKKELAALQMLDKLSSELVIQQIESLKGQRATDFLRELVERSKPHKGMLYPAFQEISNQIRQQTQLDLQDAEKTVSALNRGAYRPFETEQQQATSMGAAKTQAADVVQMAIGEGDQQTVFTIPRENVQEALKRGARYYG